MRYASSDKPRIDLIKLDVEGADLHALRGMAGTLVPLPPEDDHRTARHIRLLQAG